MLKKRLIFTLLYADGSFMLSRNFRLQKVGDIRWIEKNYNFAKIATHIDELIVLDVSRQKKNLQAFTETLQRLIDLCFIPIAVGGGIDSKEKAQHWFKSGADKIVINSALQDEHLIKELVSHYGSQSIIASLDCKKLDNTYQVYTHNGTLPLEANFEDYCQHLVGLEVGEIYLNSMDQDGTGNGYDVTLLQTLQQTIGHNSLPVIAAGGAGNSKHFIDAFALDSVDAVATANLFNFIGNALPQARQKLLDNHIQLARWQ